MGDKEDEKEEEPEEEVQPLPQTEEEAKELIFNTQLAQNGQATIGKALRERLNLEPGDSLWFKVIKVVKPDGRTSYDAREVTDQ